MRHGHDNLVEQFQRTSNDVQMTVGHRIKAAWINGPSHLRKFAEEFENEKPNGWARRARCKPSCRILSKHNIPINSHGQSLALSNYRRGNHVFAAIYAGARGSQANLRQAWRRASSD